MRLHRQRPEHFNDPGCFFFTRGNGEVLSRDVIAALLRLAAVAFGLPPESVEVFSLPAGWASWQEPPASKAITVPSSVKRTDLGSSTPVAADAAHEGGGAPSKLITVVSSVEFSDRKIPASVADEVAHEGKACRLSSKGENPPGRWVFIMAKPACRRSLPPPRPFRAGGGSDFEMADFRLY